MHTPGPWRVVQGAGCWHAVSDDGGFSTGCITFDGLGLGNAQLVAAAPDLYEAIRSSMQYLDETIGPCDEGCECILHGLHAALAKAEGRA
jgi:hypothetical protein